MELTNISGEVASIEKEARQDEGIRIQLIVFKLGSEEYALPIDQVKEIVLTPRISDIPQTPDYISGISNIRGNVITVMNLEKKFGLKSDSKKSKSKYTLVIESEDQKIGVLVNEVPITLSVSSTQVNDPSNIMQYSSLDESAINGVVKIKDRMIILIDVKKMIEVGELKTDIL